MKTALIICGTFLLHWNGFSQEAVTASGGISSGIGGSATFSIGQTAYSANTGANGSTSEGVQQAYEIFEVIGIKTNSIGISLQAFPNPTSDYLTLKIDRKDCQETSYILSDIQGKTIESTAFVTNETTIDMSKLAPAVYIIRIVQKDQELKTFKITKN